MTEKTKLYFHSASLLNHFGFLYIFAKPAARNAANGVYHLTFTSNYCKNSAISFMATRKEKPNIHAMRSTSSRKTWIWSTIRSQTLSKSTTTVNHGSTEPAQPERRDP